MADSLDDFFAKKDKKRAKDKGKTVFSAESLVRELEEGSKQLDPVRKEIKTSTAIELLGLDADDADWRDFDDVEKRDYTGLKVKEMSLQDQTDDDQRRLSSDQTEPVPDSVAWKIKEEASATTETISNAKIESKVSNPTTSDANPVSSSIDPPSVEKIVVDVKESSDSVEKKGDIKSSATKKYVPPSERNLDTKLLEPIRLSKTKTSSSRSGIKLNIQDEQDFPSLG